MTPRASLLVLVLACAASVDGKEVVTPLVGAFYFGDFHVDPQMSQVRERGMQCNFKTTYARELKCLKRCMVSKCNVPLAHACAQCLGALASPRARPSSAELKGRTWLLLDSASGSNPPRLLTHQLKRALALQLHGANWTEFELAINAQPRFPGHLQPNIPAELPEYGFGTKAMENDPAVMAKKIDSAVEHGINLFLFDWCVTFKPASN
jgi:hypothetical protein